MNSLLITIQKYKIPLFASGIFLIVIWVLLNFSLITIAPSPSPSNTEQYSVVIKGQGGAKAISLQTSRSVTRLLRKSTYEISINGNQGSGFALLKVGRFQFRKTVDLQTSPEAKRSFVGYSPAECLYFQKVLYSYACGSPSSAIKRHVPATTTSPTYLESFNSVMEGNIEGIVDTKAGIFGLTKTEAGHTLYSLNTDLAVVAKRSLGESDKQSDYKITSYRDGFIIYPSSLSPILYYKNADAKPEQINIKTSRSTPHAISLHVVGDAISASYADVDLLDIQSSEAKSIKKTVHTEVVVHSGTTDKNYFLSGQLSRDVGICGKENICSLADDRLNIYSLDDTRHYKYSVTGIHSFENFKDKLILSRDIDIVQFDPKSGSGSILFSYGKNQPCGVEMTAAGLIVCTISPTAKREALLVDPSEINTDFIDKKIGQLEEASNVNDVSIYDRQIFITPDYGKLEYDDAQKGFVYDAQKVKQVNKTINSAISAINFDKSYSIHIISAD